MVGIFYTMEMDKCYSPKRVFFFIAWESVVYIAFLVAQLVKNLPAMQETLVWFLSWEYSLEKG